MVRYKVLASIIISALVLLLPKSASALVSSGYTVAESWNQPQMNAQLQFDKSWTVIGNRVDCSATNQRETNRCNVIQFNFYNNAGSRISVKTGDVFQLYFTVNSQYSASSFLNFQGSGYNVIDYSVNPTWGFQGTNASLIQNGSYQYAYVVLQMTANGYLTLGNGNNSVFYNNLTFPNAGSNPSTFTYRSVIYLNSINRLVPVDTSSETDVADKELEGQDNIENQDTSGSDQGVSDSDYSSLLDVFTGFITAISGVSPSSCELSLNTSMGNFGEVDLCAVDPPSWIQLVGSIIVIILFVPCSMALVNRILRTIQELQQ